MIPVDQLKDGGLYRVSSRNLQLAVYRADIGMFTGIRSKGGYDYLDSELDKSHERGSCNAREYLCDCPVRPLSERVKGAANHDLFEWLQHAQVTYAENQS
jgi:hypothetical protein